MNFCLWNLCFLLLLIFLDFFGAGGFLYFLMLLRLLLKVMGITTEHQKQDEKTRSLKKARVAGSTF